MSNEQKTCQHKLRLIETQVREVTFHLNDQGKFDIDTSYYDDGWLDGQKDVICTLCNKTWIGDKASQVYLLLRQHAKLSDIDKILTT